MKKILGAVLGAVMFASASQAATVELLSPDTGEYIFRMDDFAVPEPVSALDRYNAWSLRVIVNSVMYPSRNMGEILYGQTTVSGATVKFNWLPTEKEPDLKVTGFFELIKGAKFWVNESNQVETQVLANTGTPFGFNITDVTYVTGTEPLAPTNGNRTSVVPIGGTLPLMLTALGVVGWMARRQAKAA